MPLALIMGCKSTTNLNGDQKKPGYNVNDKQKLESTALLIDASKQNMLGNYSAASMLYLEAIRKNPENSAAYYELSRIYSLNKKFSEAISYAKKAVALEPENPYYLSLLADIYSVTDQNEEALKIHQLLTKKNPRDVQMHLNLANVFILLNKPDDALKVFDHIETLMGFSEDLSIEKQKILVDQKKFDLAIEEALRLVAYVPDQPMYQEILAELYLETKQTDKALETYQKILEIDPQNANVSLYLADYYRAMGDNEKSLEQLLLAFASPNLEFDGKARILYNFFVKNIDNVFFNQHVYEMLDILIDTHADNANAFYVYADFLSRDKKHIEAKEMYLKSVEVDPNNYKVWQQIIFLDSELDDYPAMKQHSEKAMELFFEQPIPYLFNGISNYQLENYQEAASALESGLDVLVGDKDLKIQFLTMLGDTYYKLNQHEKAFSNYEKVLVIDSDNAYTLNNYSYYLALLGKDLDKALKMAKRANEIEKNSASYQDTYGWIFYMMGDYGQALTWIEMAVKNSEEVSPVVLEHYGDVLFKMGRIEEALTNWEKALEKDPENKDLEKKINEKKTNE